jgi:hypothetical protein
MRSKLSSSRRRKTNISKFDVLILTIHEILVYVRAFLDVEPRVDRFSLFLGHFVHFDSSFDDWLQQASGSCRLDVAEDLIVCNDQRDAGISLIFNNIDRNCRRHESTDNLCNMF